MQIFVHLFGDFSNKPQNAQTLRACMLTILVNPGYTMVDIPVIEEAKAERANRQLG
jgi:hypothetical protein